MSAPIGTCKCSCDRSPSAVWIDVARKSSVKCVSKHACAQTLELLTSRSVHVSHPAPCCTYDSMSIRHCRAKHNHLNKAEHRAHMTASIALNFFRICSTEPVAYVVGRALQKSFQRVSAREMRRRLMKFSLFSLYAPLQLKYA